MKTAVFDFDSTLFFSPLPEEGIPLYEGSVGPWPFKGWWGRPETLQPPIVPFPPRDDMYVSHVVESYHARADWKRVMMTGRPYKLREHVRKILGHKGLVFDAEYYRGSPGLPPASETWEYKKAVLRSLWSPDQEVFEVYEDREDHIPLFVEALAELRGDGPALALVLDVTNCRTIPA